MNILGFTALALARGATPEEADEIFERLGNMPLSFRTPSSVISDIDHALLAIRA
ncbi:hypothetical protein [Leucobacter luti]|uniref:Uncharacterized protein n=1 Tax=Leucobacter luti TaxID=340320 RepID=A0A4Q7U7P5_9MICO|nr:hypothetical protein [Leucobacter luti]RZT68558.1 hypothetical protein EV139_0283 [Leucobacter luti]